MNKNCLRTEKISIDLTQDKNFLPRRRKSLRIFLSKQKPLKRFHLMKKTALPGATSDENLLTSPQAPLEISVIIKQLLVFISMLFVCLYDGGAGVGLRMMERFTQPHLRYQDPILSVSRELKKQQL